MRVGDTAVFAEHKREVETVRGQRRGTSEVAPPALIAAEAVDTGIAGGLVLMPMVLMLSRVMMRRSGRVRRGRIEATTAERHGYRSHRLQR